MKQRFLRLGDELSDDVGVVRGGHLDAEILVAEAVRNHTIYGAYGISVFAVRELPLDELAQRPPLVRFEHVTIVTVEELRAAGLRLEPTGRNPSHFDVTFDDLDDGVAALVACPHRVMRNPYHEG